MSTITSNGTHATTTSTAGVFDGDHDKVWPYTHHLRIQVTNRLIGGIPSAPNVIEGWLRAKTLGADAAIDKMVHDTMIERGVDASEAITEIATVGSVNGFKADGTGIYIEGRQLKSAIKEAASVAVAAGKLNARKWGTTNKGLSGFIAEHVMVDEDRMHLHRDGAPMVAPDGVQQRQVNTFRGTSFTLEEYAEAPYFEATIHADWDFGHDFWSTLWLTGEKQGIGACRSQGFGRYKVVGWD
jgi:hypothetical protein